MARYSSVFSGGASNDALVFWNAGAIPTGWYFQDIGTGVFFDSNDAMYIVEPQEDHIVPADDSEYRTDFIQI